MKNHKLKGGGRFREDSQESRRSVRQEYKTECVKCRRPIILARCLYIILFCSFFLGAFTQVLPLPRVKVRGRLLPDFLKNKIKMDALASSVEQDIEAPVTWVSSVNDLNYSFAPSFFPERQHILDLRDRVASFDVYSNPHHLNLNPPSLDYTPSPEQRRFMLLQMDAMNHLSQLNKELHRLAFHCHDAAGYVPVVKITEQVFHWYQQWMELMPHNAGRLHFQMGKMALLELCVALDECYSSPNAETLFPAVELFMHTFDFCCTSWQVFSQNQLREGSSSSSTLSPSPSH